MFDEQKDECASQIENARLLATMTQTDGWKQVLQPFLEGRKGRCLQALKVEVGLDMIRRLQIAIAEIEYIEDLVSGINVSASAAHKLLTEDAMSAAGETTPETSDQHKESVL